MLSLSEMKKGSLDIKRIEQLLAQIYSPSGADATCLEIQALIERYPIQPGRTAFSEQDIILITYGDMVTKHGQAPLRTLHHFLKKHSQDFTHTVHILPFFPYSSDEGFSVIDYKSVNPDLGSWEDIRAISTDFGLMVDLVANHVSVESDWFRGFLAGDEKYQDYFITVPPERDTSMVFRPRTSPLLTAFDTTRGEKHVWTTFSADQADLNYKNPDVLLEMMDILLFYASQSAKYIRLDAVAYIWKELGTSCIHLQKAHWIIQLMRSVLDAAAPGVKLITETNVPHEDNIRYFGNGENEAQLVYNFSLPPLTLHAFRSGNAEIFTRWAATLEPPSQETAFFNFLASHDGIGITPARGLLAEEEIAEMAAQIEAAGGYVSYKTNADGSRSAYEFNINYFDALNDPADTELPLTLKVRRFVSAHAIMAALQGIPGIYFHSLFGSTSWFEGAKESGTARTINRERLDAALLEKELTDGSSLRARIFTALAKLLTVRSSHAAFHPSAKQAVPLLHPAVIAIIRYDPRTGQPVLCLHNLQQGRTVVNLQNSAVPIDMGKTPTILYQNSEKSHPIKDRTITLAPFETVWIS